MGHVNTIGHEFHAVSVSSSVLRMVSDLEVKLALC